MITYFRLLLLLLCCCGAFSLLAQDITVYNSPHKIEETMARIYVSIDKNGFSYLNTTDYQGASGPRKSSKGTIHVINFETDDVVKLAGCEPTAMLEMPLKLIVWNDGKNAFIGYTNANHFKKRYLVSECDEVIKNINRSLIRVVNDAIRTH